MNDDPEPPIEYGETAPDLEDNYAAKYLKNKRKTAVALKDRTLDRQVPQVTAAGRGKIAEEILKLAEENGVKIREDSTLAEMLATIEIDSPIPSEAFMAVAEILSYVYKANGQPNPFDAVLDNDPIDDK